MEIFKLCIITFSYWVDYHVWDFTTYLIIQGSIQMDCKISRTWLLFIVSSSRFSSRWVKVLVVCHIYLCNVKWTNIFHPFARAIIVTLLLAVGYYYFSSSQIRRSIPYGDKPRNKWGTNKRFIFSYVNLRWKCM